MPRKKNILDKISPDDALQILKALHGHNRAIRKLIAAEAKKVLSSINIEDVAGDVFFALDSIDVHDLWNRSGSSVDGYTHPADMAVEMIDEILQPYIEQVKKYQELNMYCQAKLYCMGVLKGIYQYKYESKSEFKGWAEDVPGESFLFLIDEWKKKCPNKNQLKKMNDFIAKEFPDWADSAIKRSLPLVK